MVLSPCSLTYYDLDREVAMRPLDFSEHQANEIIKHSVLVFFRIICMKHDPVLEAFSYGYVHFNSILYKLCLILVLVYYAWHLFPQRKYLRSPVHNVSYVSRLNKGG